MGVVPRTLFYALVSISPCRVLEVDRGSEKASSIFPANEVFIRPVFLESYQ
jgi:hypothetical protein